jgi:hypothetical protein
MTLIGQTIAITANQIQYIADVFCCFFWNFGVYGNMRSRISETNIYKPAFRVKWNYHKYKTNYQQMLHEYTEWFRRNGHYSGWWEYLSLWCKHASNSEWLLRFCFVNLVCRVHPPPPSSSSSSSWCFRILFVELHEERSLQKKGEYIRRIARSRFGSCCPHKEKWSSTQT